VDRRLDVARTTEQAAIKRHGGDPIYHKHATTQTLVTDQSYFSSGINFSLGFYIILR